MKNILILTFCFLLFSFFPKNVRAQQVRGHYEQLLQHETSSDIYTSLNLCKNIIEICENAPEPECWFSNIMRDVYRIKGKAEFEIYKKELKRQRLADAISSLEISYNLFKDPEVQFLQGYLKSVNILLNKGQTDLSGLVICWEAILDIYAGGNWDVSSALVEKARLFIGVAEKFARPGLGENYSGAFARYMIVLACDLMISDKISQTEQKYFRDIRNKYSGREGEQWRRWKDASLPEK